MVVVVPPPAVVVVVPLAPVVVVELEVIVVVAAEVVVVSLVAVWLQLEINVTNIKATNKPPIRVLFMIGSFYPFKYCGQ